MDALVEILAYIFFVVVALPIVCFLALLIWSIFTGGKALKKTQTQAPETEQPAEPEAEEILVVLDSERRAQEEAAEQKQDKRVYRDANSKLKTDGAVKGDGPVRGDGKLRHDGPVSSDEKVRIHRDNEEYEHDKSKRFYDPKGDYTYDEEAMNQETEAFREATRNKQNTVAAAGTKRFKHKALVQAVIMKEILDKPKGMLD